MEENLVPHVFCQKQTKGNFRHPRCNVGLCASQCSKIFTPNCTAEHGLKSGRVEHTDVTKCYHCNYRIHIFQYHFLYEVMGPRECGFYKKLHDRC